MGRELNFALSVILSASILFLVPYDEQRVAFLRLETLLRQERNLKDEISRHCNVLLGPEESAAGRFFRDQLAPFRQVELADKTCTLAVESSSAHRYRLKSHWTFALKIQEIGGKPFVIKTLHVEFPQLIAFLPFAIFLLALLFDFAPWNLAWTVGLYLFFLGGANAIRTGELVLRSSLLTLTTDATFQGLFLALAWMALFLSRRSQLKPPPVTTVTDPDQPRSPNLGSVLQRAGAVIVGLWNPLFHTLLGRFFFPVRGSLAKIQPFLESQLFAACASLYLFAPDLRGVGLALEQGMILPRYFSFSIFFFLAIGFWTGKARPQEAFLPIKEMWRAGLALGLMIIASLQFPRVASFTVLFRVGFALLMSELLWPKGILFKEAARRLRPWAGALFLSFFTVVAAREAGMIDLVMVLVDPGTLAANGSGNLVLSTFLSGLGLGFLTGNFSIAYFALLPLLIKAQEIPLIRAALLDGAIAGALLSPLSLFNLLPAAQFGVKLPSLVASRFRLLGFPLLIAIAIYAVSAINSLAILQPATFVFLCLIALAIQLSKAHWSFGKWVYELPLGK